MTEGKLPLVLDRFSVAGDEVVEGGVEAGRVVGEGLEDAIGVDTPAAPGLVVTGPAVDGVHQGDEIGVELAEGDEVVAVAIGLSQSPDGDVRFGEVQGAAPQQEGAQGGGVGHADDFEGAVDGVGITGLLGLGASQSALDDLVDGRDRGVARRHDARVARCRTRSANGIIEA